MGRAPVNKKRINNLSKQKEIAASLGVIIFKNGFSDISTEDLCDITNKSKATIYKYFRSKEEIIAFITSEKLAEIQQFSDYLADNDLPFSKRYKNAVELVISAFEGISYQFLFDLKNEYPQLFEAITLLKDGSISLLEEFYKSGIHGKAFRDLDPKMLAANDDIFFTAILETDFLANKNFGIKELFENYFRTRFEGLLI